MKRALLALVTVGALACQSSRQHGFVDEPVRDTDPPVWVEGHTIFVQVHPEGATMPASLDYEVVDDTVLLSSVHISAWRSTPYVLECTVDPRKLTPGWEDRLYWLTGESARFGGASAAALLDPSTRRKIRRVPAPGS